MSFGGRARGSRRSRRATGHFACGCATLACATLAGRTALRWIGARRAALILRGVSTGMGAGPQIDAATATAAGARTTGVGRAGGIAGCAGQIGLRIQAARKRA
jgi:hypothetical protein